PGLSDAERYALIIGAALEPPTPALWGFEEANDYFPAASSRLLDLSANARDYFFRWAPLFSARYLSVSEELRREVAGKGPALFATDPAFGLLLFRSPIARRRAYLTRPRCVADRAEALATMQASDAGKVDEAIVECPRSLPVAPPEVRALGRADIVSYAP